MIGIIATGLLMTMVPDFEGTKMKAYKDVAGVWTICTGDTENVRPGMVETKEGCQKRLVAQLEKRAPEVLACTPTIKDNPYIVASAVSLSYNIGVPAYCKSTAAKRFNTGDFKGGCEAFLPWDKARVKGVLQPVKGLTIRRHKERDICLTQI